MDRFTLEQMARQGEINAIVSLADELQERKQFLEAQRWYFEGCEAGNFHCMSQYAKLTTLLAESRISIMTGEAQHGLRDLEEAQKWAVKARDAGRLEQEEILSGTCGIYAAMTWCCFLLAMQTKEESDYHAVLKYYKKIIQKPRSRESYAYINALTYTMEEIEEKGEIQKEEQIALCLQIYEDHDSSLRDNMLEEIILKLRQVYFEGISVKPSYQKSYRLALEAYELNPKKQEQLLDYYQRGQAKKDYDALHGQGKKKGILKTVSTMIRRLRNVLSKL